MRLPSKEFMSLVGNSAKNYSSKNMMGLGMFAAGGLISLGATNNARNNGLSSGNSVVGMAGLGMMGFGGHKLSAGSLFSAKGRGIAAQKLQNTSSYLKANRYDYSASLFNKSAAYARRTTRW